MGAAVTVTVHFAFFLLKLRTVMVALPAARPVILPLSAQVLLWAHGSQRRRFQLAIDGQTLLPITDESQVEISRAEESIRLIRPEPARFFDTLRRKQAIWNQ